MRRVGSNSNKQLTKELAEHKQAAEAAREGEINLDLIVNSIPVPVAVTSPSVSSAVRWAARRSISSAKLSCSAGEAGEVEALNQPTLEYFGRTFEEVDYLLFPA